MRNMDLSFSDVTYAFHPTARRSKRHVLVVKNSKDFFLVLIAYIGYGSCTTMRRMSFGFEKESKAC